ncbi:MAG: methyltransferase domain-containing protein [Ignavibacteriae bacterium]|nr:methyltransferase domain-containing protein [Ignavibacteriota bacterium]
MKSEIKTQMTYWDSEADSFQKIYSHEKSPLSVWLDKFFRKDMYERFLFTLEHSAPIENRTFLDVGCGNGLYAVEFALRGAKHVTGIDIAKNMLELCTQFATAKGVQDRCSFIQSDLLEYAVNDIFDISIGIGLFDYIQDAVPVLQKMKQVTTDRVILSFPRFWTWRAPVRKIRLGLRGCPVYFYTKKKLVAVLREAGFQRFEIHSVGKLFCVVAYSANRERS